MRKTPEVAKRRERGNGGGRENHASHRTTGVIASMVHTDAGITMAKSVGTTGFAAGTKSVRWGWACNTSQQVALTVVVVWRWSTGAQSAACPRLSTECPPITQVMRAKAGAAVPRSSTSMAATERPLHRRDRMSRIGVKDTRGGVQGSAQLPKVLGGYRVVARSGE